MTWGFAPPVINKHQDLEFTNSKRVGVSRAGLVGLSLSYALPITGLLNGLLTSTAETEQEMVAVERMLEFSRIPPQVCKSDKQHPCRVITMMCQAVLD